MAYVWYKYVVVFTVFKVNIVLMASVSVFCILCAASLRKTSNRRPLVPLLTTYVSLICGRDRGLTTTTIWTGCSLSSAIESQRPWEEGSSKGFCHCLWAAIQKRRDREGNVSLPTLGLVAARCILGLWWHNILPC